MPADYTRWCAALITRRVRVFALPSSRSARHKRCPGITTTTFYVVSGAIRIFLQQPKEEVRLTPGQTYCAAEASAPVTNAGDTSAVFLVLQGIGQYDFVPLT